MSTVARRHFRQIARSPAPPAKFEFAANRTRPAANCNPFRADFSPLSSSFSAPKPLRASIGNQSFGRLFSRVRVPVELEFAKFAVCATCRVGPSETATLPSGELCRAARRERRRRGSFSPFGRLHLKRAANICTPFRFVMFALFWLSSCNCS